MITSKRNASMSEMFYPADLKAKIVLVILTSEFHERSNRDSENPVSLLWQISRFRARNRVFSEDSLSVKTVNVAS